MNDLISRSALLIGMDNCISRLRVEAGGDRSKNAAVNLVQIARDYAANLPAVDAVEVVRCRYCEYWKKAKVNKKGFLICPASGMEITARDFCSYGERRSDDATD